MDVAVMERLESLSDDIDYYGGGINALLAKSAVKSVQRGIANFTSTQQSGIQTHEITIATIDPSKAFCIVGYDSGSNAMFVSSATIRGYQLSADKITVTYSAGSDETANFYIPWQVIEFY